jgi:peptidoglycan/LPS O-acetylase OafA/YrhL
VSITVGFLVTLAGALLLATILTYAVERPAMRSLRRRYGARRDPVVAHL